MHTRKWQQLFTTLVLVAGLTFTGCGGGGGGSDSIGPGTTPPPPPPPPGNTAPSAQVSTPAGTQMVSPINISYTLYDVESDPVHEQQGQGDEDLLPELRQPEDVKKGACPAHFAAISSAVPPAASIICLAATLNLSA